MGLFTRENVEDENEEIIEETEIEDDAADDQPVEDGPVTFEVGGRVHEIRYPQKRLDLYESGHKPVMATFVQNGGAFSRKELRDLTAYGLKVKGGGFVSPKQGMVMADKLIEENGYATVLEVVAEALQRDCGFLFK